MKLAKAVKRAKRVYLIGNGGSAANAIHIAQDLQSIGVKAYHLCDAANISRIANDHGFEYVFSDQIEALGEEGDLLIALSGSGTSSNILKAIEIAEIKGMATFLVTDYLRTMDMQKSEEQQLVSGHEVMRWLKYK